MVCTSRLGVSQMEHLVAVEAFSIVHCIREHAEHSENKDQQQKRGHRFVTAIETQYN